MTCVKTLGLIIAFGKSFSTFTIVAPGVVFGGLPAVDLVVGVVVTLLVVVNVDDVVEHVVLEVVVLDVVVTEVAVDILDDAELVVTAGDCMKDVDAVDAGPATAEDSSGDVETTLETNEDVLSAVSAEFGLVAFMVFDGDERPLVSTQLLSLGDVVVDCTSLDCLASKFSSCCLCCC